MSLRPVVVFALLTLPLIACGESSDTKAAPCEASPIVPRRPPPNDDDEETGEVSSEPAGPDDGGMKATPKPTEACDGTYACHVCDSGKATFWLHSDGERCLFGNDPANIVLHSDGRVTSDAGREGTWTGDRAYFRLDYPRICARRFWDAGYSDSITCERQP